MNRLVIKLISFYQVGISIFFGSRCRFYPSCSQYTKEAIQLHGLGKGIALGTRRITRCHPWHEGGYDPVPGSTPGEQETVTGK
ncbi:MAG: membrane protein insertion efficiency factor YidD [Gammaproteobacteria bacterium]